MGLSALDRLRLPIFRSKNSQLILRLFGDQGRKHAKGYFLAISMMAVVAGATFLSAWIMKPIIDKIFIEKNLHAMWAIGGAIVVIYIAKGLATYGQQVAMARIANNIIAEIQTRIFDKMLAMDLSFFDARHSTEFIARQSFIAGSASAVLSLIITALGRDVLTMLSLIVNMFIQDPLMALLALVIMPGAVFGVRTLGSRVKSVVMREFQGYSEILETLQETAQGIRVVKAFTLEPLMRERQQASIVSFERAANKLSRVGAKSSPLMETLGGLTIALVVVYGGHSVIVGGAQPGSFFSFLTALLLAYEPAKRVARLHIDLTQNLTGVGMLYEFLDEELTERETNDEPELQVTAGRIEFSDVRFSYREGEAVLDGLNLVAEPGQTTALVGRSGGGKTTTMSMLPRFYEPTSGAIFIDGENIAKFSRASVRRHMAYVGQDTFLFKGSVHDNIASGRRGATEDQIVAAAKAAHAHEFIMGFERGYDSPCGEHGAQLSGGQRQRIAIARAFLKDAPIILLDEATSALDTESERAVQDALKSLCAGRTTLVIAHRLSTIANAERICVIEGGQVREFGTQDELLAKGELYFHLHKTQFKGSELEAPPAAAQ